jgi:hypothetical protein
MIGLKSHSDKTRQSLFDILAGQQEIRFSEDYILIYLELLILPNGVFSSDASMV